MLLSVSYKYEIENLLLHMMPHKLIAFNMKTLSQLECLYFILFHFLVLVTQLQRTGGKFFTIALTRRLWLPTSLPLCMFAIFHSFSGGIKMKKYWICINYIKSIKAFSNLNTHIILLWLQYHVVLGIYALVTLLTFMWM